MEDFKQTLILVEKGNLTPSQKVQIIELLMSGLEAGSITDISKLAGISYNGIKKSSRFKKLKLKSLTLCFNGVKNDDFPF
jgi:hypothetical protein